MNATATMFPILRCHVPASVLGDYAANAGLSFGEAELRARELEKYLVVCAENAGPPLVPSLAVDDIWHSFILHTRDYAAFCGVNFGKFIHHRPASADKTLLRENYLETVRKLEEQFGEVDESIWPVDNADCSPCGQCDGDS